MGLFETVEQRQAREHALADLCRLEQLLGGVPTGDDGVPRPGLVELVRHLSLSIIRLAEATDANTAAVNLCSDQLRIYGSHLDQFGGILRRLEGRVTGEQIHDDRGGMIVSLVPTHAKAHGGHR